MWSWFVLVMLVVLFFFVGAFVWWGLRTAMWLAANSLVGYFALYALSLFMPTLPINFWSVGIVALTGVFGLILIVGIHLLRFLF